MKVIIPKKFLRLPDELERAIENGLDGAAKAVEVDFKVTAQTWKHTPEFSTEKTRGARTVSTTHQIYLFVTGGTKAHVIRAKNGKALAFSSQHRAKTTPRTIGSGPGGRGPTDTMRRAVRHPGTAAREFEVEIAKKWQRELPDVMQRAIDSEVR